MKKIFGVLFALFLAFAPFAKVFASSELETIDLNEYETLNFTSSLTSENIELSYKDYKETDDQVTIYLFRGQGCGYCKSFLTFLNSIAKEYGKYFKVVSFESWSDQKNSELLENLSNFMGSPAKGVPYIIIGDQVFPGYASDYDDSIKSVITTLYESDNRYDVIEAYNDYVEAENKKASKGNAAIILWNAVFIVIATGVIMFHITASNRKMLRIMGYSLSSEIDYVEHDEIDEEVEETEEAEEVEETEEAEEVEETEEVEEIKPVKKSKKVKRN